MNSNELVRQLFSYLEFAKILNFLEIVLIKVFMKEYFVPYFGNQPASLCINGHRLVIISQDRQDLVDHLSHLGGDRVEGIVSSGSQQDEVKLLEGLAESAGGGVVVAPSELTLDEVIRNLESELPWIQ